jgi:hypothetical protein
MYATLLRLPNEVAMVNAFANRIRERATHCATCDDLCDATGNLELHGLVVDLNALRPVGARDLARRLRRRAVPLTVYALHDLSESEIHTLVGLARLRIDLRAVYRPYHTLDAYLDLLSGAFAPSATPVILRRVGTLVPRELLCAFTACVVRGERRATLGAVAAAVGTPLAKLRVLAARIGFRDFRDLIAALRITHAMYRINVLGASVEDAASRCGFAGRTQFETFVHRRTCQWPVQFSKQRGFDGLLRDIDAWFPPDGVRAGKHDLDSGANCVV